jgi:hypothetical protein
MFFLFILLLCGNESKAEPESDINNVWVSFEDKDTRLIGYKDKDEIKIEPKFTYVSSNRFDNIIAVEEKVNGKWKKYYLTKAGKIVGRDSLYFADKRYDCESEGFIRFKDHKTKKMGMFNRNGDVVIPAKNELLTRAKNGMIITWNNTKKHNRWKSTVVDTLNNVLINNFDGNNTTLDFFSIEKSKTPSSDTIRKSFLATDGNYYSFINYEKEFKQWLVYSLLPNVTENGYFIPQESNFFIFNATKMNEGSGGWWLYGEDKTYYYGLNAEPDFLPKYFKLQKGKEPKNFDKFNYKTW